MTLLSNAFVFVLDHIESKQWSYMYMVNTVRGEDYKNKVDIFFFQATLLISLHIRSMWETICDALASWSGWEFGSKIPVYPILGFGSQNTPIPPPPPENWNLGRSWHFKTFQFWLAQNTLPPANSAPLRYVETNICIPADTV